MSQYQDKQVKCINDVRNENCEGTFTYTARDQEFYESRGYDAPKRCKSCRTIKKNRANSPFTPLADRMRHEKRGRGRDRHDRRDRRDY